jgi:hypothetical protein
LGDFGEFAPGNESRRELFAIECRAQQMPLEREVLPDRPEAREKFLCRFRSRKPRMRRSRSRVGWWLFSARLFSRAAALTNTCFTFAGYGISAFAAG